MWLLHMHLKISFSKTTDYRGNRIIQLLTKYWFSVSVRRWALTFFHISSFSALQHIYILNRFYSCIKRNRVEDTLLFCVLLMLISHLAHVFPYVFWCIYSSMMIFAILMDWRHYYIITKYLIFLWCGDRGNQDCLI